MKSEKGFTVLETLIAISILAILMAIGVPSYRDFIASRAVSGQVSDLASTIRLARAEAIKRAAPVSVCRTENPDNPTPACTNGADWSSGWIVFVDRGNRGTIDAGDIVVRVQQAFANSGGIERTPGTAFTFLASGIAPGAASNVLFRPPLNASSSSYSKLSRRMCMNNTGTTRLINGDAACG